MKTVAWRGRMYLLALQAPDSNHFAATLLAAVPIGTGDYSTLASVMLISGESQDQGNQAWRSWPLFKRNTATGRSCWSIPNKATGQ